MKKRNTHAGFFTSCKTALFMAALLGAVSCVTTDDDVPVKLVFENIVAAAGTGESEINITWHGGISGTTDTLAVIVDWYASDAAMEVGDGETGRLAAQIDMDTTEKIVVKNGTVILRFAKALYKKGIWNVSDGRRRKNIPLMTEYNEIIGLPVMAHPKNSLITIAIKEDEDGLYPEVKRFPLPGRDIPPDTTADPSTADQPSTALPLVDDPLADKPPTEQTLSGAPAQIDELVRYNVAINNEAAGPFTIDELRVMAQNGQLTKESLVWTADMPQWEPAGNVPELAELFPRTVAQPSPPPQTVESQLPKYTAALDGIASGPYSLEDIHPLIDSGRLTQETLVWKEGASQWMAARSIEELAALFPSEAGAEDAGPGGFFILIDGQPSGPLSLVTMKRRIEERELVRSSLVWKEGMHQWAYAERVPELASIFPVIPPPPPPQTGVSAARYYMAVNGRPEGPFSTDELRRKQKDGELTRHTLLWKEDMPQWAAAGGIPELASLFGDAASASGSYSPSTAGTAAPARQPTDGGAQAASQTQPAVSSRYHVAVNGFSTGPFTMEELTRKVRAGQLTMTTQVWKSGMTQWAPAGTLDDLKHLFNE